MLPMPYISQENHERRDLDDGSARCVLAAVAEFGRSNQEEVLMNRSGFWVLTSALVATVALVAAPDNGCR